MFDEARARARLPEALFAERIVRDRPRLLCTGGAVRLAQSFSGSSYYMAAAGIASGKLDGAFTLFNGRGEPGLRARGLAWKAKQALLGRRTGGFKFTTGYQDHLWRRYIPLVSNSVLIHQMQLTGRHFLRNRRAHGIGSIFYVDGTLREYFDAYGHYDLANVDPAVMEHAITIEREGYLDADAIFTMSRRSEDALVGDYGVDRARITVVPPGANIPDALLDQVPPRSEADPEFVLGFVGLYPERKGLPRLISAVRLLRKRGHAIRVRVIGRLPEGESAGDGVEFLGRIDKRTDMAAFLEALSQVDLGCQLSYAELAGIALCEFLRLGIPVIGTRVGGATDILNAGGSIIVDGDIDAATLAQTLETLITDPQRVRTLKAEAKSLKDWASWSRVIESMEPRLP